MGFPKKTGALTGTERIALYDEQGGNVHITAQQIADIGSLSGGIFSAGNEGNTVAVTQSILTDVWRLTDGARYIEFNAARPELVLYSDSFEPQIKLKAPSKEWSIATLNADDAVIFQSTGGNVPFAIFNSPDASLVINPSGQISLSTYGSGVYADPPAYYLAVTATGQVVETAGPGGGTADGAVTDVALNGTDLVFTGTGIGFNGTVSLGSLSTNTNGIFDAANQGGLVSVEDVRLQTAKDFTFSTQGGSLTVRPLNGGATDFSSIKVVNSSGSGLTFGVINSPIVPSPYEQISFSHELRVASGSNNRIHVLGTGIDDQLVLANDGSLTLGGYGSGTFSDTPVYLSGFTAGGQLIEVDPSSIGGGDGNGLFGASNEGGTIAVDTVKIGDQARFVIARQDDFEMLEISDRSIIDLRGRISQLPTLRLEHYDGSSNLLGFSAIRQAGDWFQILAGTARTSVPFMIYAGDNANHSGALHILSSGQLQFGKYISDSSFTGTAEGMLVFDSNGNILTAPLPSTSNDEYVDAFSYEAVSRTLTLGRAVGSDLNQALPLFSESSTNAGLVQGSNGSTTAFLRGDNTWVIPPNNYVTGVAYSNGQLTFTRNGLTNLLTDISGVARTDESIQDMLSNFLKAGLNISLDYDDPGNQLTINATDTNSVDYVDSVVLNGTDLEFTGVGNGFDGTIDLSSLVNSSNNYVSAAAFDILTGNLTLTRQGLSPLVVDLDGRYVTTDTNDIDYIDDISLSGTDLVITAQGNAFAGTIDLSSLGGSTNNYVTGGSFDTGTGEITLTRSGLSDLVFDIEGRYITDAPADGTEYVRRNNAWVSNSGGSGAVPEAPTNNILYGRRNSAWVGVISGNPNNDITSGTDSGLFLDVSANIPASYLESGDNISELNNDAGYLTSATNNYVTGVDFDTSDGNLTLTRAGLGDLQVNLDGRYLTSDSNFYISQVELTGDELIFTGVGSAFDGTINLSKYDTGGTVTNMTVGAGLDITSPTTTPFLELNFNEFLLSPSFDSLIAMNGTTPVRVTTNNIPLSSFPNDLNLPNNYVTSGAFDDTTGELTLTRSGLSDITIDLDGRYAESDTFVTGVSFDAATGNLTLTRNGVPPIQSNLDGRYSQANDNNYISNVELSGTELQFTGENLGFTGNINLAAIASPPAGGIGVGWDYNTVTSSPPSSGTLRFNNGIIGSATTLWINDIDSGSNDMSGLLGLIEPGNQLLLTNPQSPGNYIIAEITAVSDETGFYEYTITNVEQQGSLTANDLLSVDILPNSIVVNDEYVESIAYAPDTRTLTLARNIGADLTQVFPLFDTTGTNPGLVPGSNGSATVFLRGDGTWAAVSADTNFAKDDLTLTGNRVHVFGSNKMTFDSTASEIVFNPENAEKIQLETTLNERCAIGLRNDVSDWQLSAQANGEFAIRANGNAIVQIDQAAPQNSLQVRDNGQMQFPLYVAPDSFDDTTAVGILAFDSIGRVLTAPLPSTTDKHISDVTLNAQNELVFTGADGGFTGTVDLSGLGGGSDTNFATNNLTLDSSRIHTFAGYGMDFAGSSTSRRIRFQPNVSAQLSLVNTLTAADVHLTISNKAGEWWQGAKDTSGNFYVRDAKANKQVLEIDSDGKIILPQYGSSARTGTLENLLGVTTSGDVIEIDPDTIGADGNGIFDSSNDGATVEALNWDIADNLISLQYATNTDIQDKGLQLGRESGYLRFTNITSSTSTYIPGIYGKAVGGTVALTFRGILADSGGNTGFRFQAANSANNGPIADTETIGQFTNWGDVYMSLLGDGTLNLQAYGGGTKTGNLENLLAVTDNGQVIEVDPDTIGSSTDRYISNVELNPQNELVFTGVDGAFNSAVDLSGLGSGVTIGTDNQVPYVNAAGDDFDYNANFTFDGDQLSIGPNATGGANRLIRAGKDQNATTSIALNNDAVGNQSSAQFQMGSDTGSGFFGAFSSSHGVTAWRNKIMFGANSTADGIGIAAYNPGQTIDFIVRSTTGVTVRINQDGSLEFRDYGDGSNTGTLAQLLGVTTSGDVIEVDPASLGGGSDAHISDVTFNLQSELVFTGVDGSFTGSIDLSGLAGGSDTNFAANDLSFSGLRTHTFGTNVMFWKGDSNFNRIAWEPRSSHQATFESETNRDIYISFKNPSAEWYQGTRANAHYFIRKSDGANSFELTAARQLVLPAYTAEGSFTGTTPVGILAFDASGNILTQPLPSGGGGTDTNFATDDLTFTGNRVHSVDGNTLQIKGANTNDYFQINPNASTGQLVVRRNGDFDNANIEFRNSSGYFRAGLSQLQSFDISYLGNNFLEISAGGALTLNQYGGGTKTGTLENLLAVTTNGQVIEVDPSTIGGGGTDRYISNVELNAQNELVFTGVDGAFNSSVDLSSLGGGGSADGNGIYDASNNDKEIAVGKIRLPEDLVNIQFPAANVTQKGIQISRIAGGYLRFTDVSGSSFRYRPAVIGRGEQRDSGLVLRGILDAGQGNNAKAVSIQAYASDETSAISSLQKVLQVTSGVEQFAVRQNGTIVFTQYGSGTRGTSSTLAQVLGVTSSGDVIEKTIDEVLGELKPFNDDADAGSNGVAVGDFYLTAATNTLGVPEGMIKQRIS